MSNKNKFPLRDALRALVAPMEPAEFIADYWNQRTAYIPGTSDKFADLFDTSAFYAAINVAEKLPTSHRDGFNLLSRIVKPIAAASAEAECNSGNMIAAESIHVGDDQLAQFAAQLKQQLWFPGTVSVDAYLSPPGTGISFLHFDTGINTAVQIDGRKKWRFADQPSTPWPNHGGGLNDAGHFWWEMPPTVWEQDLRPERDLAWTEVVLEPGDFICLPAGTLHQAEATDETSLSLNFAFRYSGFERFIAEILGSRLSRSVSWRSAPPAVPQATLRPGAFPEILSTFIRARLQEARAELDAMDSEFAGAEAQWQQAALLGKTRDPSPIEPHDIQPDSWFRVQLASLFRASELDVVLATISGRAGLNIPRDRLTTFARQLRLHDEFDAKSAIEWTGGEGQTTWIDLQKALSTMIQRGILERVNRPSGH